MGVRTVHGCVQYMGKNGIHVLAILECCLVQYLIRNDRTAYGDGYTKNGYGGDNTLNG